MKPHHSKLKNPDKHIAKLKDEIARLHEVNKDHWRRHGVHEFMYRKGSANLSVALDDPIEYPKLLPGTEVIFRGKVSEVHRTEDGGSIKFAVNKCKRVEPREG